MARAMVPTGLDQFWAADISYIRLLEELAYLAVALAAISRRIVGCVPETHLQPSLALGALDMALLARRPVPGGLVHPSDRGVLFLDARLPSATRSDWRWPAASSCRISRGTSTCILAQIGTPGRGGGRAGAEVLKARDAASSGDPRLLGSRAGRASPKLTDTSAAAGGSDPPIADPPPAVRLQTDALPAAG